MSLVLAWRLNHKLIELHGDTQGQTIGVLRRNGSYTYVRWLGFIERERAKEVGTPVKLRVHRIGRYGGLHIDWEDLPAGAHVLGCRTAHGVFAVAGPWVRVI